MFDVRRILQRALAGASRTLARPAVAPAAGRFETRTHEGRRYKLFVPNRARTGRRLPLVVMLHGCGQDPDGFARDTRMNEIAQAEGFLVLYPQQAEAHNSSRCWNWFEPAHQSRGAGEPAEIVAMIDAVAAEYPVDPARIYVAGLSAGAAMSVVLGATYPDRFAAIGVSAGLPYQGAGDCLGALTLMKRVADRMADGEWFGPWQDYWLAYVMCWATSPNTPPALCLPPAADPKTLGGRAVDAMGEHHRIVPMILFQGTGDVLVEPGNGDTLAAQWTLIGGLARERLGAVAGEVVATTEQGTVPDGRSFTVTTYRDGAGKILVRAYAVEGMGHSWSGGAESEPAGEGSPLTDPLGPDASRLIWSFFEDHPMPAQASEPAPARTRGAAGARERGRLGRAIEAAARALDAARERRSGGTAGLGLRSGRA